MRIEVYNATTLVAVLEYKHQPIYHGDHGEAVKRLVEARHRIRNPWTGEHATVPRDDSLDWWVATILYAGLGGAGYHVALSDVSLLLRPPLPAQN